MPRPFQQLKIDQLEARVERDHADPVVLRQLLDELSRRRVPRAKKLHEKVQRLLAELEKRQTRPSSRPPPAPPEHAPAPPTSPRTPVAPADGVSNLLSAWTALEVLSPQAFNKPEDLKPSETGAIRRISHGALPWDGGPIPGRTNQQAFLQVSLGELKLRPAFEALQQVFAEERPDRFQPRAFALLAVVVCDRQGVPQEDRIAVSSFGWGLRWALARNFSHLDHWQRAEAELIRELRTRLCRKDEDGTPLPLDWRTLESAHDWLLSELQLNRDFVQAPSFAIVDYVYTFTREPAEALLLNSFFLNDLRQARSLHASGQLPTTLDRYLRGTTEAHRNVLTDPTLLPELLAPARTPASRWPSPSGKHLVTLQQAAVNAAACAAPGELIAVNGPPGTGKTTLLRDLLASVVTTRAEVLASFDDPARAFKRSGVSFTRKETRYAVHELDQRLRGFELVVASSNNAAVENVSAELPRCENVAPATPRYFASIASAVSGEDSWGLIAAVLGKRANISEFRRSFWEDKDRGMETYLAAASGRPQAFTPPGSNAARDPKVLTAERPPNGRQEALSRWSMARRAFQQALDRSRHELRALQRIHQLEAEAHRRRARVEAQEAEHQRFSSEQVLRALEEARAQAEFAQARLGKTERLHADSASKRPGLLSRLFTPSIQRAWREAHEALGASLDHDRAEAELTNDRVRVLERTLEDHEARGVELARAGEEISRLERDLAGLDMAGAEKNAWRLAGLSHESRQVAVPWLGAPEQRLREELFGAALRLHRAFIDAAAEPIQHNLAAFFRHDWTGVPGASASMVADLWATLCLVVPLISTTFASTERMFSGLRPGSLGWLLLDEAGQASPQAAVGALMRARRAMVVGDPLQIEPVVGLPLSLVQGVCRQYAVEPGDYAAPFASAQVLADRASPYCASYSSAEGTRHVGLPLLVHRRCEDPMFSISNQIAYGRLMVYGTPPRDCPAADVLGPSRWINVEGSPSDRHWCTEEGLILMDLLNQLADEGTAADLYVVSPFRAVAEGVRALLRRTPRLAQLVGALEQRVGTVHTVQGREADLVFLVLGAPDPTQFGARAWAGQTPNLLNVAVTRARHRLYVIGNRRLWKSAGVFATLHDRLPHA